MQAIDKSINQYLHGKILNLKKTGLALTPLYTNEVNLESSDSFEKVLESKYRVLS